MHGYKNINTKIVSFIPKYVKRQQIELVELSFFAIFCWFNNREKVSKWQFKHGHKERKNK